MGGKGGGEPVDGVGIEREGNYSQQGESFCNVRLHIDAHF